jgi:hypothetical protein
MAPLYQRSCVACVGRSALSLYDTRATSKLGPSATLRISRSSMGVNAPARASLSPEGSYIACIMNQSVNVYDFRKSSASRHVACAPPLVKIPFIAEQKPLSVCWMPTTCGFSIACGNSTGDISVHEVSCAGGRHTGTLFNQLRAACCALASVEDGIASQNATGVVNYHSGRRQQGNGDGVGQGGQDSVCRLQ